MEEDEMNSVCGMGEKRNAYRVLVGKCERKRPLERHGYRWKKIIKMDLKEIQRVVIDWIHLAQDSDKWRGEGCCEHGSKQSGSIKSGEFLD
jgi:hypothetical protein